MILVGILPLSYSIVLNSALTDKLFCRFNSYYLCMDDDYARIGFNASDNLSLFACASAKSFPSVVK